VPLPARIKTAGIVKAGVALGASATEAKAGAGDFSSMAISPTFSKGIYAMESRLKAEGKKRPYIKVQTTGPLSFALTITDENKRAIYYNEEFISFLRQHDSKAELISVNTISY